MAPPPAPTERWTARPRLALLVRVLVVAVPVLVGILTGLLAAMLLPTADGPARLLWWLVVLAASTAGLLLTDRVARRALPLAVLLELSLVFPDRAPSRLRAARTGSVAELERRLDRLRANGADGPAVEAAETLVILVGVLGLHDKRTRGHSERVRALTDLLTCELGLSEDDRAKLRWASLVHDLGKLRVPVSVLNGGKDLADEEWEALRRHPQEGQRLAGGFVPWLGEWGRTIIEHHERWDGGGYPAGLSGEQISYGARIVAVADSFEVMTAARSYAPARSAAAARAELARCAGSQFDPEVVRAFLGISVRRLSWVLGPVTWAAEVPLVATVDRAGQFVKAASVVALTAGLLGTGALAPPSFAPGDGPRDRAEAEDADLAFGERTGRPTSGAGSSPSDGGAGTGQPPGAEDADALTAVPGRGLSAGSPSTDAAVLASELRRDAAMAGRSPAPAAAAPPPSAPPAPPAAAPGAAPVPGPAPAAPAPAPAPAAPAPAPAPPAAPPAPATKASPATPAERAEPAGPGEPAEPAQPAQPAQPAEPAESAGLDDESAEFDESDESDERGRPSKR